MAKAIRVMKDGPNVSVRMADGSTKHLAPGEVVMLEDAEAARYLGMTPCVFEAAEPVPDEPMPVAENAIHVTRKARGKAKG